MHTTDPATARLVVKWIGNGPQGLSGKINLALLGDVSLEAVVLDDVAAIFTEGGAAPAGRATLNAGNLGTHLAALVRPFDDSGLVLKANNRNRCKAGARH